jgi:hypothetical protein
MQHRVDMGLILVKDMFEGFNEHTYWVYVWYHRGGETYFKNKMPIEPNKF